MTKDQPGVHDDQMAHAIAARDIMASHRHHHLRQAQTARTHSVYVYGEPVPAGSKPATVEVENTLRASIVAEALYHQQQADRFDAATEAIERIIEALEEQEQ